MRKFLLSSTAIIALTGASAQAGVNYAAAGMSAGQIVTSPSQLSAIYKQVVIAGKASGFLTETAPPLIQGISVGFGNAASVPIVNSSDKITGWDSIEVDSSLSGGSFNAAMVAALFAHELSHVQTAASYFNADNLTEEEKASQAETTADMDAITYFTQDPQNQINWFAQAIGIESQRTGNNLLYANVDESSETYNTPWVRAENIITTECHTCSADSNILVPMVYVNGRDGNVLETIDDGNLEDILPGSTLAVPNVTFTIPDANGQYEGGGDDIADNGGEIYGAGGYYGGGSGGCGDTCNY